MTSTAVRLSQLEQLVDRLVLTRGVRVGDALRQARARVQAGEPLPPRVYDVATLEHEAARGGVIGQMAKARLRASRRLDQLEAKVAELSAP